MENDMATIIATLNRAYFLIRTNDRLSSNDYRTLINKVSDLEDLVFNAEEEGMGV